MDDKEVAKLAKASVLTWFNRKRLVLIEKDITSLKRDAYTIKKLNLNVLDEVKRKKKWDDMRKVFKYRFGMDL